MVKNNNLNFHDAYVHNIVINLEKYVIILRVTPYRKGINYEGERVEIQFVDVDNVQLFEGSIKEGRYIYSLEEEKGYKGKGKKYIISFNSDVKMHIICKEMIIK